ncbi:hypothetical protein UA08_00679 [Talaromyces atroroseus]|uniref:Uncharacterized protein n=1 Tax=Talaromyces atroroseus TaxID=1441469 RepID=A0A225BD30_TALAT|nr:hypothetical protein UA08_00679 [Talaromyces atroroseus]OKL63947.1 hypothetical protein UA08_00679 [Talaromyces atroroseus]
MEKRNSYGIPTAFYRGGTSKALFFHEDVLPAPGPARDRLLKRVMGSPDPLQLDGMGGSKAVTSKIAIVKKSSRENIDVDYTFAQVGIADDTIFYGGNCGNISAAVGPFAIEEGLVEFRPGVSLDPQTRSQEVRIYNTGTEKTIVAHVTIDESGLFVSDGTQEIAGVPGQGSPILMDYRSSTGATLSKGILPSGKPTDTVKVGGRDIEVSICDVANPCVFVNASDFDITGHESAAELTANSTWKANCRELRGKVAQLLGLIDDWEKWDAISPFAPLPIFVTPPQDPSIGHISARLFLDKMCHESMAGTGAICAAACSRVPGTVVNKVIGDAAALDILNIIHPIGVMSVYVQTEATRDSDGLPTFRTLSFVRTARRIMDGKVYVPKSFAPPEPVRETPKTATPEATKLLAEFVNRTGYDDIDDSTKKYLKNLVLDYIGVTAVATREAESTAPVCEAISRLDKNGGNYTVIGMGQKWSGQYAALLNGFLGHSLDFDDTYADGFLHAGVTTIAAGLTAAEHADIKSEVFLAALAVGYEVTCRIGRVLGEAAYSRGFHNTATAGIFGAVATLAKIKGLSSSVIETAFGLAGSKAAGSMQYLENGSWNKRLHPGFAIHDAWLCVELAEAGVVGATKILEGKFGFFNAYSPAKVDYAKLLDGLGTEWAFLSTIWKPFPACRMTHGLIIMIDDIRSRAAGKEVRSITVNLPTYQVQIVGAPAPNKVHPQNIVDAQFSAYYQVALAWLHGGFTGWSGYKRLHDADIHALTDRITVVPDQKLGHYGQRVTVEFSDGLVETKEITRDDEAGGFSHDNIVAKYLGLAASIYGEDQAQQIKELVYNIEQHDVRGLMALLK